MSCLLPGLAYAEFVAEAARFRSEAAFRASPFFARHGSALTALLATPVIHPAPEASGAGTNSPAGLRVAHWNIEKGKQLARIIRHLREDAVLAAANVITLNEVDDGMVRSGPNADVALELGQALGMTAVYLPLYIECTRGVREELRVPGENRRGLHGLAILARGPVLDVRVQPLPSCWDYFDYPEKRFGGRAALFALIGHGAERVVVGTAHLEMRTGPSCRARQFRALLGGVESAAAAWGAAPVILSGDWNSHTFRRGSLHGSILDFFRITLTPAGGLDRALRDPVKREPLFRWLAAAGFGWDGLNDGAPTAFQSLGNVEDLGYLPGWLGEVILRISRLKGRVLGMRLDWIAARGARSAGAGETRPLGASPEEPASDHLPIAATLELLGGG